ncbi:MAG: DUF4405 domain-containing protein [Clostridiales bacterium]|nr:DUF4405 domain-containing protein [Clostridiales bacterium]
MPWKKKFRLIVDISMTIAMPVLMSYELAGAALHEYLGIVIFAFFIIHHALNFRWIKGIRKGNYNTAWMVNLMVNLLLLVIMFLIPISGIMMSEYVFPFLYFPDGIAAARIVHLLASYWGFLLMSLHIGLHGNAMLRALPKHLLKKRSGICGLLPHLAVVSISLYGIYAFIRRDFAGYLFLRIWFVYYDFSEPLLFFLADYVAIMMLFASIGYYFMLLLRQGTFKIPKQMLSRHKNR